MNPLDRQVLTAVNSFVGGSRPLFEACLLLCGELPLAICVAVLLALWWTDPERRRPAAAPVLPGGTSLRQVGLEVSRRRCVALAAAIAASFGATRIIAFGADLPRPLGREPLVVPIESERWTSLVGGMTGFGAFPSDHAALFFALAAGLFSWGRIAGWLGLGAAALFSFCRVAVGFHYPSDMLAGAGIGAPLAALSLSVAKRTPAPFDRVVSFFDRRPAIAYPLLFLIALDFTRHFRLVMKVVFALLFTLLGPVGGSGAD